MNPARRPDGWRDGWGEIGRALVVASVNTSAVGRSLTDWLDRRHPAPTPPAPRAGTTRVTLEGASGDRILTAASQSLSRMHPEFSAASPATPVQAGVIGAVVATTAACLWRAPIGTCAVLVGLVTALYLTTSWYRISLLRRSLDSGAGIVVDDAAARSLPDGDLPTYTILIPAYHEAGIIEECLAAVGRLEYPADKLDVKVLTEEDDPDTIAAAMAVETPFPTEVVVVPPRGPRTKPKACNVGLALARGELITIYDVEDRPEPLQLRRAVATFAARGPSAVCLQAKLSYYNADQNLITRWFTAEYLTWFAGLLPGLVRAGAPIPLGGTSNHLRTEALRAAGGWDPHNVTEDAELGVRLHRLGYRVDVLDSTTEEEANSDYVNWVKQRSRWHKGYLQTWLVHMRHPLRTWRDLGTRAFVGFNLFVAGTPLLALLNPVFWALTALWFTRHPAWVAHLFPTLVYYPALLAFVIGNFAAIYAQMLHLRAQRRPELLGAVLLLPLYWGMMAVAAVKAVVQLVSVPSYWEKTAHGLDHPQRGVSRVAA